MKTKDWVIVVVSTTAAVALGVLVLWPRSYPSETREQKYARARMAYSTGDPWTAETRKEKEVVRCVQRLMQALGGNNSREFEQTFSRSGLEDRLGRRRVEDRETYENAKTIATSSEVEVTRVFFDGEEFAQVYARWYDEPDLHKARFFLVRGYDEKWRVYDIEDLHDGWRLSRGWTDDPQRIQRYVAGEQEARKGHGLKANGRFEEALQAFTRADELYGEDDAILKLESVDVLFLLDRDQQALDILDAVLASDVDAPVAHLHRAIALMGLERWDEARDAERRYRECVGDDNPRSHVIQAGVARARGDLDGMVAHLRRAIAVRPEESMAHKLLGQALLEHGERDEALDLLEQSCRNSSNPKATLERCLRALNAAEDDQGVAQLTAWFVETYPESEVALAKVK